MGSGIFYIALIFLLCNTLKVIKNNSLNINIDSKKLLDVTFPMFSKKENYKIINNTSSFSFIENMLNSQFGLNGKTIIKETKLNEENNILNIENLGTYISSEIIQSPNCEVIKELNIEETYTNEINNVKIKNTSDYALTDDMFEDVRDTTNKNILIYHTHTCESYTPSEMFDYEMTGNYRTTDLNYTVAKVGDELTNYLETYNFNVIHDKTVNDYPAYNGSYDRSLVASKNILTDFNADLVIDLHRDAVGEGNDYGPSVRIGDEVAAQMMFVMGTDGGGLYHPDWIQNLRLAVKIQSKANELYPGLFRPILVRNSRYNQHLTNGTLIIEVGATANTLEQTLVSMKYLSYILNEVFGS